MLNWVLNTAPKIFNEQNSHLNQIVKQSENVN